MLEAGDESCDLCGPARRLALDELVRAHVPPAPASRPGFWRDLASGIADLALMDDDHLPLGRELLPDAFAATQEQARTEAAHDLPRRLRPAPGTVLAPGHLTDESRPGAIVVEFLQPAHSDDVTAIAAWSHACDVLLDDGRTIRLPSGRLRLECDLARAACMGEVSVAGVSLLHWRLVIPPGARLNVRGPFTWPAQGAGGYREAPSPPSPTGVPIVFVEG